MSDKAWEELVDLIETRFGIDSKKTITMPLEDRSDLKKNIDEIIFMRDGVKLKIERVISPAIIDKKTIYRRSANATSFQYIYDDEIKSNKVYFYKLADKAWEEIPPEKLLN
ncbi:MAG: hypothetical protein Q8P54_01245 [bacterium]|nr:hypothetical protein [bacterium]